VPASKGIELHRHQEGLVVDLETLMRQRAIRRGVLRLLGAGALGIGAVGLAACGGGSDEAETDSTGTGSTGGTTGGTTGATTGGTTGGTTGTCSLIPPETDGPFPGDGSQSTALNVLTRAGVVRSDIRSSIDGATGVAGGVPLELQIELVSTMGCAPLSGYAVYLWHCTADGLYSMYSDGVTGENFLRGVQITDAQGKSSFTTIVPGCYAGRWPHMHFEVFANAATATSLPARDYLMVSQLALPEGVCRDVYGNAAGYGSSLSNLNNITLASDGIFRDDNAALQMVSITGSVAAGYVALIRVAALIAP
jgi:protocatechuate 3,4-dioxygenase beta subunit